MAMVSTSSSRPYHIIIFGASGFTGQFVIEEVARTSAEGPGGTLKWAIAGRSKQKLEKVLEQAADALGMYCILASYRKDEFQYRILTRQNLHGRQICAL